MSVQTLYSAATGMAAMETKLDVIANNLANVETTAFKRGRVNFEDLFYRHEQMPGEQDASGLYSPIGVSIGLGSRVAGIQSEFRQGAFEETGGPLDLAIEGPGFFQVTDPATGEFLYTRAGKFSINADGQLVLASAGTSRLLEPPIQIPQDATQIAISDQGIVSVRQPGSTQLSQVGTIELATFLNPEGLLKLGENLYAETDASGTPTTGTPGQQGRGVVKQGFLEASNVEPVRELIDLITTQRAFELNSQAVQVGDEIMQLVANLRRL
ncbi:MAG TPA: flagellar basal-body rod protein FlgG [Planctomycetaceae bacterium]|nr:flagellar basal-body rod protein FlgG [Planctomycetaceae bacterium]HIQ19848.1 flagellar basal-body rod protein FlgG [Planctomycetota bacterium]